MTSASTRRIALAAALAVAALLALSASPALARRGACSATHRSRAAGHGAHAARRRAHGCSRTRHTHGSSSAHARPGIDSQAVTHAGSAAPSGSSPARVAPSCADGVAASTTSHSGSCAGGGEPGCPAGDSPTLSSSGAILYCTAPVETDPESTEGCEAAGASDCELAASACEDGGAPHVTSDGGLACADDAEPHCADGSTPTLASDEETLLCPIGAQREPES